jgi:hypothetical protein
MDVETLAGMSEPENKTRFLVLFHHTIDRSVPRHDGLKPIENLDGALVAEDRGDLVGLLRLFALRKQPFLVLRHTDDQFAWIDRDRRKFVLAKMDSSFKLPRYTGLGNEQMTIFGRIEYEAVARICDGVCIVENNEEAEDLLAGATASANSARREFVKIPFNDGVFCDPASMANLRDHGIPCAGELNDL